MDNYIIDIIQTLAIIYLFFTVLKRNKNLKNLMIRSELLHAQLETYIEHFKKETPKLERLKGLLDKTVRDMNEKYDNIQKFFNIAKK